MGKKSSPSPPPAPDPKIAIDAQADANRYDVQSPFGQTTWSESDDGRWTQTNMFSPEVQAMFDRTLSLLGGTSSYNPSVQNGAYGNARYDGIPNDVTFNKPGTQSFIERPGSPGHPGYPSTPEPTSAPEYDPYGGYRDLMMQNSSKLIKEGFDPQIESFQQEMANRGVPEGSELYNDLYEARVGDPMQQAYEQAAFRSIAAGNAQRVQDYNMLSNLWGRNTISPAMPVDAITPYRDQQTALNNQYALDMQRQNAQYAALGGIGSSYVGKK